MPKATDACLIQDSTSRDIENRFKNDHPMKHDWTMPLREPSNRAHSWCYWIRQTSTFSARTGHPLWSKWPHLYPGSLIYFKCFWGINSLHFKKLHKQKLFSRKKKLGWDTTQDSNACLVYMQQQSSHMNRNVLNSRAR
jgi:hypothetical protein